jgi:hypothetical protein
MIGREGDAAELVLRLSEGIHSLLAGPRRIGKTSVCWAVAETLREQQSRLVVWIEAPKQTTATGFCQLLIDQCARIDLTHLAREGLAVARPAVEALLKSLGVPLDLSVLARDLPSATRRAALELPLKLARQHGVHVVFCVDELQRAVDYADGEGLIGDLVDIYSGQDDVVLLVNGSHERVVGRLLEEPYRIAKLVQRRPLDPRIPRDQWVQPLTRRFERAGLSIAPELLAHVLDFGQERPYDTMTAGRYIALTARKLELTAIDEQSLREGLREAREHLDDDDD